MSRPRTILFVNSWSTAHGGSSTSLIDIVTHLDPARFRPVVLCPEEGDLPARLRDAGIPVVLRGMHRPNREELYRFLREVPVHWRWLRAERVALVHGNTSASRRSIVQATASAGIPYVQHVRNVVRNSSAYGYQVARRIVCNSDSSGEVFRNDARFAPKTQTIYNAVDLSAYDGRGETRRAELGLDESQLVVGFVGQLVPRKGVVTLIRAMATVVSRLPGAQLVIAGCAPPDEPTYEAECRQLVANLGLDPHVRFIGYRRDVPAVMRTVDVFALPTRSEPFGKVVIEAMAAETPVVATHVGGIPEIVTGPELGTLIAPDEPGQLANALVAYLANRDLRRETGRRGAASVRARFGMDVMLARIQALYDDLLAGQSAEGSRGAQQQGAA